MPAGQLPHGAADGCPLRRGELAERPAQQRRHVQEVLLVQVGDPAVQHGEQVPVVHQQQPAASQEPLRPRGLARRGNARRQRRAQPGRRLRPGQQPRVGQQPGDPPGDQPVHVPPVGHRGEHRQPAVARLQRPHRLPPRGLPPGSLREQRQRRVHPVERRPQFPCGVIGQPADRGRQPRAHPGRQRVPDGGQRGGVRAAHGAVPDGAHERRDGGHQVRHVGVGGGPRV